MRSFFKECDFSQYLIEEEDPETPAAGQGPAAVQVPAVETGHREADHHADHHARIKILEKQLADLLEQNRLLQAQIEHLQNRNEQLSDRYNALLTDRYLTLMNYLDTDRNFRQED